MFYVILNLDFVRAIVVQLHYYILHMISYKFQTVVTVVYQFC
nr:unnamed protein product [Callosobruchus analis]